MAETDELYNKILQLERNIENIDAKLSFSLSSDPKVLESALLLFKKYKKTFIPTYLAVDGNKNVTQIASEVNRDLGNTSRTLRDLHERGFIDKVDEINGSAIYKKNQFEKILRLSEKLEKIQ